VAVCACLPYEDGYNSDEEINLSFTPAASSEDSPRLAKTAVYALPQFHPSMSEMPLHTSAGPTPHAGAARVCNLTSLYIDIPFRHLREQPGRGEAVGFVHVAHARLVVVSASLPYYLTEYA
jgi:hypothetical protein